jgi:hypothetical protein
MSCNGKISNLCADPILSTCVDHEAPLGVNTKITDECVNQSDVNTDLYAISDEIIEGLDVSSITSTCITIPVDATVAEIITLYETKICELDGKVTTLENTNYANINITEFGLTIPACIADSCANPPQTLAEWMQVFMDQRNCT